MNDLCRLCDRICGNKYKTSAIFMFYLKLVIFPTLFWYISLTLI